jgi:hypothetical protein
MEKGVFKEWSMKYLDKQLEKYTIYFLIFASGYILGAMVIPVIRMIGG